MDRRSERTRDSRDCRLWRLRGGARVCARGDGEKGRRVLPSRDYVGRHQRSARQRHSRGGTGRSLTPTTQPPTAMRLDGYTAETVDNAGARFDRVGRKAVKPIPSGGFFGGPPSDAPGRPWCRSESWRGSCGREVPESRGDPSPPPGDGSQMRVATSADGGG